MRTLTSIGSLISVLFMAGCASKAEDISASYISPVTYESYSCSQLREEAERVSGRAGQAAGIQDEKPRNDTIATAATVIIFWPAAFFVSGNGANAAEVARLKGQIDAIEQASIKKHCGLDIRRG